MPNFSRIVSLAYMRILQRPPDPGGLQNFNLLMNQGVTEAMMRETLLRSPEYATKNPDVAGPAGRSASKGRRKTAPRKNKPGKR